MTLITVLAVIFGLAMGLAFTFWGMRVFLVLLPVWGFFAGFWIGALVVFLLLGASYLGSSTAFISALIVGIIFCIVSYMNFEAGITLVTAAVGIALAAGVVQALGLVSGSTIAAIAVVVAVLLVWVLHRYSMDRYLIIVITSLGGASLIVAAGLLLFGRIGLDEVVSSGNVLVPVLRDSWIWALVWLVIAAVGIFSQLRAHRGFDFTKHDLVEGWG